MTLKKKTNRSMKITDKSMKRIESNGMNRKKINT